MAKKKSKTPTPTLSRDAPAGEWKDEEEAEAEAEAEEDWKDEIPEVEAAPESFIDKVKHGFEKITDSFHHSEEAIEKPRPAEPKPAPPGKTDTSRPKPKAGANSGLPLSKVPGKMRKFLKN